ncbi:aminodeoxychorismate lyase [Marinihelvus fidelis]|uniref:Aminodeoxychorismate lyase n=1 Tax=Marinihelvus fidelis TaxID=2613842 RepID=A0A5N0TAP6_9GAMM|nr:aminodeoxychorismate lyase [Marinihelvus fidelis]KAA9132010.1 aminodeoxychorismate lyase [Marinihelvus fidelis]
MSESGFECLVNGEVSDWVRASDRGFAYGDGLFETFAVEQGRPRFWQAHIDRLGRGCETLGLAMPPQELLLREVRTAATGQSRCVVKVVLTRGVGGRGYAPAEGLSTTRVVSSHPFPDGLEELARGGVRARTCDLRLALQPALGGIKHLNRLEQVLAAREMAAHPGLEGILVNQEGFLISGLQANLFLVVGRTLLTPRMDRCGIRGVLRGLLLRDFKSRAELRRIHPGMLEEVDEVFLCSALRGITPVTAIDEHEWRIGAVTREMQEWFEARKAAT